jgi:hypothetical protein
MVGGRTTDHASEPWLGGSLARVAGAHLVSTATLDGTVAAVWRFSRGLPQVRKRTEFVGNLGSSKPLFSLEGARARPPEDVGGPSGYQEFLEVLLDPSHKEHKEAKRWAGRHFDPERFDLDLVNKDVARALHANLDRPKRR